MTSTAKICPNLSHDCRTFSWQTSIALEQQIFDVPQLSGKRTYICTNSRITSRRRVEVAKRASGFAQTRLLLACRDYHLVHLLCRRPGVSISVLVVAKACCASPSIAIEATSDTYAAKFRLGEDQQGYRRFRHSVVRRAAARSSSHHSSSPMATRAQ